MSNLFIILRLYCKFIRYISIFYSKSFCTRFINLKNIINIYSCILCVEVKFDDTVWIGVGWNLVIISGIRLIQAAKKMLVLMGQVSLITSVKIV